MFERWKERRRREREQERQRWEQEDVQRQLGSITSVATVLGQSLDRSFQMETKLLEGLGGLITVLQDASAKKAAQVLGSRGGSKRAANAKKKKLAAPECPLCRDPMARNITWPIVEEHNLRHNKGTGWQGNSYVNGEDQTSGREDQSN